MSAGGQRAHHEQAAQVHDDREQEGVGATSGVATEEVAGAPGQDCGHAVSGGRELGRGGHVRRG
jgi:hypothetical protein